jgi:Ca2+-binding RTX toxin-like protein
MADTRIQAVDTSTTQTPSFLSEVQPRIDALEQQIAPQRTGGGISADASTAATSSTPTSGDDILVGTPGNDLISALAGNDTVIALAGDDRIFGGPGRDDIVAGGGNDFADGGIGDDLIFGGIGPNQDFDSGNDTIIGGGGADTLFGQDGNDDISGGDGNDNIDGGFGVDIISGGAGSDTIFSQDGGDTINGDGGADIITSGFGEDNLRGGAGNDRLFAGSDNDQLFGEDGNDQLNADAGDDIASGGNGSDTVFGGQGNDSLNGEAGADSVIGGDGNDSLSGGNGNDRLTGVDPFVAAFGFGRGERDNLSGGGGSDTFVLGGDNRVFYDGQGNNDFAVINDFNLGQDFIELPANPQSTNDVLESGDAGQLLSDAQVISSGTATLSSIAGTISNNNDVDLYQLALPGGGTFSATTVGGADFDTQLFLFNQNGNLVDQNDDSIGTLQSTLPASPSISLDAGIYYLAISSFNNDPLGSPLGGFSNEGFSSGNYTLFLTGVSAAPPENAGTFSVGATPAGIPQGTAISFENDLIGVVAGVSPSQLSLDSGNFVFV